MDISIIAALKFCFIGAFLALPVIFFYAVIRGFYRDRREKTKKYE